MLGAEPEALRGLSGSFRSSAARLDTIAAELDASVRRSGWRGPDAARFLATWESVHRRPLVLVAERCRQHAVELDRQAGEQVLASSAGSVGLPSVVHGIALGGGSTPASDWAPVRVAEPPHREIHAGGGLDIGVGFGVLTLGGEVSIADLGDDRSLLTWTDASTVGLGAAAGGSLEVTANGSSDGALPLLGAEVAATAGLGVTVRRSWEVPTAEVPGLLVALAVERASLTTVGRTDLPTMAGRAVDSVVGFVTGRDPGLADRLASSTTGPPPTHVERFAQVDTAAALRAGGASAAGAGLAFGAQSSLRIGERLALDGSERSVILELDGDLAHRVGGSMSRSLGLPDQSGDARTSLRVEVPDGSGPATELHLTTTSERDGALTEQRVALDLRRMVDGDELLSGIAALRSGDPGASLAHFSRVELPPDAVDVSVLHPHLDRSAASAGASASIGLGGAVRSHGQVVEIRR